MYREIDVGNDDFCPFLTWMVEGRDYSTKGIICIVAQPWKHQKDYDFYRDLEDDIANPTYIDPHPMERLNKIGKVKDLIESDECDKYHKDVDEEAMRRAMK